MTDSCFVCLDKCSRKVCFHCSCRAHPLCWKNYQAKCTQSCPVCKTTNVIKPYQTRSTKVYDQNILDNIIRDLSTQLIPRKYIITTIFNLVKEVSNSSSKSFKIEKIEKIMYWLLAGIRHGNDTNLLLHTNLYDTVLEKILFFEKNGWPDAFRWHNVLFNLS
jgi:hypothetical protein